MSAAIIGGGSATETASASEFTPGSICVSLGFEQHYGECWNDSLSMILLFADGYKEIIQPLLIDSTHHSTLIDSFITKVTPPLPPAETGELRDLLEDYLQFLSYRFQYHIQHIKQRGNSSRKYNRDLRRLSFRCSYETSTGLLKIIEFLREHDRLSFLDLDMMTLFIISIGGRIKTGTESGYVGYNPPGAYDHTMKIILKIIHTLFGISYSPEKMSRSKIATYNHSDAAYYLTVLIPSITHESHVVAVFKCNGVWYLYDDNLILLNKLSSFSTKEELTAQINVLYEETIIIENCIILQPTPIIRTVGGGHRKTHRNKTSGRKITLCNRSSSSIKIRQNKYTIPKINTCGCSKQ